MGAASKRRRSNRARSFFSARAGGSLSFVQAFPARPQMQGRFPQTPSKEITWEQQANGDAQTERAPFFQRARAVHYRLYRRSLRGRRFIFRALRGKSKKRIKHEKAAGLPRRLSLSLWLYLTIVSPASLPNTTVSTTALPPRRFAPWMPPVTSPAATRPGITSPLVSSTRHSVSIFTPPIV